MNAKPHSPEWLIENADHGIAFEVACASALERLLTENASLQQQLEAIGAGGVGPLMPRSRPDDVALSRAAMEQALDAFYEWWNMRPSLTRLQAWLLWKDQAKAEGGAA